MSEDLHKLLRVIGSFIFLLLLKAQIDAWRSPLRRIPAIGYSGVLTSYITAVQSVFSFRKMVQEGLDKYGGAPFRIPMIGNWMIVVAKPELIDEFRKAPDDALSFEEAAAELLQMDFTLGPEARNNYHIASIRTPLTRSLAALFPDLYDEIKVATSEFVPATDDWTPIIAYEAMMHVVCRTSNRVFVGLPYCRDPDYCKMNEETTIQVAISGTIIGVFPEKLRPLVSRFVADIEGPIARGTRHLGSVIEDRLEMHEKYGSDWDGRPNDMISWLIEYAHPEHRKVRNIVTNILTVNFASIHNTTNTLTHALFDLIAHPECIGPIREEIESVVAAEGWTKAAMSKMRKFDSFIRESQRLSSSGAVAMVRRTMRDYTLNDGTVLPAGCFVAGCQTPLHFDPEFYEDPESFNGFRYSDIRQEDGEGLKHQATNLNPHWIHWGVGRHACPGRFMAINEVKALLAHILITYDVTTEDGLRPKDMWLGTNRLPAPKAKVLFRKRRI